MLDKQRPGDSEKVLSGTQSHTTRSQTTEKHFTFEKKDSQAFCYEACQEKKKKKCTHNPNKPSFFKPSEQHRNKSWFIKKAMKLAELAYFRPYEYLVNLFILNRTWRKKKSQRRESMAGVLQVLIYYTDLESFDVKIPRKGRAGQFDNLELKKIAKLTGYSLSRVKSAMRDLRIAGYVVTGKRLCADARKIGVFKSGGSYIRITTLCWSHLGITQKDIHKQQTYKAGEKNNDRLSIVSYVSEQINQIRNAATRTFTKCAEVIDRSTEKIPRKIGELILFKTLGTV